jgi:hypothetical protein
MFLQGGLGPAMEVGVQGKDLASQALDCGQDLLRPRRNDVFHILAGWR